jgi:predicted MPP superfamily phosphohydrolase
MFDDEKIVFQNKDLVEPKNCVEALNGKNLDLISFPTFQPALNDRLKLLMERACLDPNHDGIIEPRERRIPRFSRIELPPKITTPQTKSYAGPGEKDYNQYLDQVVKRETSIANDTAKLYFRRLPIANLPSAFENFTILHISDLHFRENEKKNTVRFEKLIAQIKTPIDLVILTGDIVDEAPSDLAKNIGPLKTFLPGVKKIAVIGDHDVRGTDTKKSDAARKGNFQQRDQIINMLRNIGITVLNNETLTEKHKGTYLNVIGLDVSYAGNPLPAKIAPNLPGELTIGIAHNLDAFDYTSPKVNLILSGHLHSGELNLGIIDGTDYLRMIGAFKNINGQVRGVKFLGSTTSHISPGLHEVLRTGRIAGRLGLGVEYPGISILQLTKLNQK